ncbi:hypothetical protein RFI_34006 [Reticulomyxa filosa]|uniref:TLDc domain-containing protein n=1 Tax=Reticulomyxa filosa TaxID=46433 RepID=X6LP84_RETFI|nr:hypothetical protein RFI_34006 [Reticulomyxa filosa]|eukprot:ETO03404.1 hypothetical protein RFI_34006 [Reticulomyxa filosa]
MQLETTKKAEEGERSPEDVLKDFLDKNKVKKSTEAAEKFSQIGVTLEDLMQYREKEIEELCADAGISVVSKIDLCKVLRSTPDSYAYKEAQRTKVVLPPLILQASEQEKLDAIYEKVKKVSEKVMAIDKEVEQMERESQEKKKEINGKFEEMISNMTKHKEKIINELEEIKNKKINEMKKMREELVKKEKEMKEWNEKWNEAMSDPNTDIYVRKQNILNLIEASPFSNDNKLLSINHSNVIDKDDFSISFDFPSTLNFFNEKFILIQTKQYPTLTDVIADISVNNSISIILRWTDNFRSFSKYDCLFAVQSKLIEDLKDEKDSNDEKTNQINQWKDIKQFKLLESQTNQITIQHSSFQLFHTFAFRIRAFYNSFYATPFSNVLSLNIPSFVFFLLLLNQLMMHLLFCFVFKNPKEDWILQSYLPKKSESKLSLLYRGSRDGFRVQDFHSKCDNQGPTLTIVQSNQYNHVFGGFTNISWTSPQSGTYMQESESFIYLLRSSKSGQSPTKWTIKTVQYAVYHCASTGPRFGGGHDFHIADQCNTNNGNYSNAGNSYNCPSDQNLLAGAYNFTVKELEVYKVQ